MKEYSPIKVVINDGDSRDTSEESLITIKQKQCLDLGEKNRVLYKKSHVCRLNMLESWKMSFGVSKIVFFSLSLGQLFGRQIELKLAC